MMSENEQYMNEQISAYLDGEMTQSERAEFERELSDSAELAARVADYQEMKELLMSLPEPELPDELHQQIMSSVRAEAFTSDKPETSKRPVRPWHFYAKRICVTAASLVLVLFAIGGVAWLMDGSGSGSTGNMAVPQTMMIESSAGGAYETYDMGESAAAEAPNDSIAGEEAGAAAESTAAAEDEAVVLESSGAYSGVASSDMRSTSVSSMDVKEYYVTIVVDDMEQAVAAIAAMDGYDKYAYIDYGDNYASASIDRAVSSGAAEETLATVSALGEVTNQSQWQSSMLNDYNDALAGYEAKQEEYLHLLEILELTSSYEEVSAVMEYLDNCVASMENYQSAMRQIENQISTPVIHITLEQKGGTVVAAQTGLGERVADAFQSSVEGVVSAAQTLVLICAWLIVPLAILAAVAAVVILIRRRKRKGKKKGGAGHE